MATEKKTESVSDVGEERTYNEIATAIETGSSEEKKTPDGAQQVAESDDTDKKPASTSQPTEPQTLEEALALLKKVEQERDHAQSKIGHQGNELGEIRREISELKAARDIKGTEKQKDDFKSYVELFKEDKKFQGMNDASKEYLGHAFDLLEQRMMQRVTKTPEIETLQRTVMSAEEQRIQQGWEAETRELIEKHGKELVEKYGVDIYETVNREIKAGADPRKLKITKIFRDLAFDDLVSGKAKTQTDEDVKAGLNDRGKRRTTRTTPQQTSKTDYSKLSEKDAWAKMVEEDKARGVIP